MASYDIEITQTVEKQFKRLPLDDQAKIVAAILALAEEPRPRGSRKLVGYTDVFRVRVGMYRLLYSLSGRQLIMIILKVGHRRDVYR